MCNFPLRMWKTGQKTKNGKDLLTFDFKKSIGLEVLAPCGQCMACRLKRSREWAIRCMHEGSMHDENCFITLTYSPEFIPSGDTLVVKHFQDFMKRLRFRFSDKSIRFLHCGEYGEKFGRPHYHALLFGLDFPDKELFRDMGTYNVYISQILSDIWGKGFCTIGDLNYQTAQYVSSYILKKQTGKRAKSHYGDRLPEYITMSRRKGIGYSWLERYKDSVFPNDFIVINPKQGNYFKVIPPKFYLNSLNDFNEALADKVKSNRLFNCLTAERKIMSTLYENEAYLQHLEDNHVRSFDFI